MKIGHILFSWWIFLNLARVCTSNSNDEDELEHNDDNHSTSNNNPNDEDSFDGNLRIFFITL